MNFDWFAFSLNQTLAKCSCVCWLVPLGAVLLLISFQYRLPLGRGWGQQPFRKSFKVSKLVEVCKLEIDQTLKYRLTLMNFLLHSRNPTLSSHPCPVGYLGEKDITRFYTFTRKNNDNFQIFLSILLRTCNQEMQAHLKNHGALIFAIHRMYPSPSSDVEMISLWSVNSLAFGTFIPRTM